MLDQVRVLVVDDSAFMRHIISSQLQTDRSIQVVDTARDGLDAIEKIRKLKPDVVTLDVDMPRLDGLATLTRTLIECPVPIIMLSSSTREGATTTVQALTLGAVDFIAKPSGPIPVDIHKIRDELVAKVKQAAGARICRGSCGTLRPTVDKRGKEFIARPLSRGQKVLIVGCSTGGPSALHQLIPLLPRSMDAAVLVVQHLPPGFTRLLANHLNDISQLWVKEAEPWDLLSPGLVLLAPGDFHTVVKTSGRIELNQKPQVNGVRPSADVTMKSAASVYGASCIAVILTGVGCDGTRGASAIKAARGYVIAEDASTCVAEGMPKGVIEAGAADKVVPLPNVAEEILLAVDSETRAGYFGHTAAML
ncbi:MAG: chemotaxis response regulator protein-glutamate methylesterase [Chloroflexi bacterium]|nr:chemotaxis response regulator protein-glutamate methylesterase [Chloroflexota bacterium]